MTNAQARRSRSRSGSRTKAAEAKVYLGLLPGIDLEAQRCARRRRRHTPQEPLDRRIAHVARHKGRNAANAMRLRGDGLMRPETARRGRLFYVALGFLGLDVAPAEMPPELHALHAWLDTRHGIGVIEHGLARQDRATLGRGMEDSSIATA